MRMRYDRGDTWGQEPEMTEQRKWTPHRPWTFSVLHFFAWLPPRAYYRLGDSLGIFKGWRPLDMRDGGVSGD